MNSDCRRSDMVPSVMDEYLELITRFRMAYLHGYPSAITLLAAHARRVGWRSTADSARGAAHLGVPPAAPAHDHPRRLRTASHRAVLRAHGEGGLRRRDTRRAGRVRVRTAVRHHRGRRRGRQPVWSPGSAAGWSAPASSPPACRSSATSPAIWRPSSSSPAGQLLAPARHGTGVRQQAGVPRDDRRWAGVEDSRVPVQRRRQGLPVRPARAGRATLRVVPEDGVTREQLEAAIRRISARFRRSRVGRHRDRGRDPDHRARQAALRRAASRPGRVRAA